MIDCGSSEDFQPIGYVTKHLPACEPWDKRPLSGFVCTHPHSDHISEIRNLHRHYQPSIIWRQPNLDWKRIHASNQNNACFNYYREHFFPPRGYTITNPQLPKVGYPFDSGDHNILWLAIGGPRKGLPIAPRFQACDGHGACVILDRPETQPRGPIACRPASGAPGCILGAVCWRPWIDQTTTPRGYLSQVDTPFYPIGEMTCRSRFTCCRLTNLTPFGVCT